jgi:hypothetical protein
MLKKMGRDKMLQLIVVTASVMEDKIGFKTFASVTW